MNEPKDLNKTLEGRTRIKKRQLFLVLVAILGLSLLVTVQHKLLNLGPGLSSNQGVITLVSINFSVLTLAFLLYLILRGLYRVFFEQKGYGSLQTKMVVSFISLSLLPTILIFYFAYLLIGQDHDTWFGRTLRNALERSLVVGNDAVSLQKELRLLKAELALDTLESELGGANSATLEQIRAKYGFDSLEWYSSGGDLLGSAFSHKLTNHNPLPPQSLESLQSQLLKNQRPPSQRDPEPLELAAPGGDSKLVFPLGEGSSGFLAFGSLEGDMSQANLESLEVELQGYQAAIGIERPFQVTQLTSLAAVTLLAVFLSIWIGSNLAGSLAGPVTELVEGTRRVAHGELDFELAPIGDSGEMAHLVKAFNLMTRDLKASYQELDQRRRFVETVLREVSSGVIVLDNDNKVMTINQAASSMLNVKDNETTPSPKALTDLIALLKPGRQGAAGRIFLDLNDGPTLSLNAHRTNLKSEHGEPLGSIITFDDVSDLEKAQRLSAWREVAKRIAHEVKNPLTPISLAAQRLKRRFWERIQGESDSEVFEECISVIIRQVDTMRSLVDEFSQFARLPQLNPRPADLKKLLSDTLALFREANPDIEFFMRVQDELEDFVFDPEQMGRVLTNLLGNATAALKGRGKIEASLSFSNLLGVEIRIEDNGPGLPKEIRDQLFEPYVKSATGGQGLGLSIVKAIINDHGGFVRVEDKLPHGTVMVVTLPYVRPGDHRG